jgi:excisionase family DNA binding protein
MGGVVIGAENDTRTAREHGNDRDSGTRSMPMLLTVDDAADLLRTTKRAVYAMIERRQLPGITRIGRRVLLRADDLLHWLDQKRAPSLQE